MAYKDPIRTPFEGLILNLKDRPVVWVGAGASMAAGYPSLEAVVSRMLQQLAAEGSPLPDDTPFYKAAEIYRAHRGPSALGKLLDDHLGSTVKPPTEFHAALARLAGARHLRAIVTTNYDGLIETALKNAGVEHRVQVLDQNVEVQADVRVLKIHGDVTSWKSTVLSESSYAEFDQRYERLKQQFDVMLRESPVIFVGCSMKDPRILDWLARADGAWVEALKPWRPLMKEAAWNEAVEESRRYPGDKNPLARGYIQPLIVQRHEELPVIWTRAASQLAPHQVAGGQLEGAPFCVGRANEVRDVAAGLVAEDHPIKPVPVLGPAGIGKGTVAAAALYEDRVVRRFGQRRYFVRCDGCTSSEAVWQVIALKVGVEPGPGLEGRTREWLGRGPVALVLDNFETPWEANAEEAERLLRELATIRDVALAACIRGAERPIGVQWSPSVTLQPLSLADARTLFLETAGRQLRPFSDQDTELDPLLTALDCVPMAVWLLGLVAAMLPDVRTARQSWDEHRTAMLQMGRHSVTVALATAINSPRVTKEARRLLSVVSALPGGIAEGDLRMLERKFGVEALSALRRTQLVYDTGVRLRVLSPIREHVARHHPISKADLRFVLKHYESLVDDFERLLGTHVGRERLRRAAAETTNIEALLVTSLKLKEHQGPIRLAPGFVDLLTFTGQPLPPVLTDIVKAARARGDSEGEAHVLYALGNMEVARNARSAEGRFQAGLRIHSRRHDLVGMAQGQRRLGDLARVLGKFDEAERYLQQSLTAFQRLRLRWSEARTLRSLGNLAGQRSRLDQGEKYLSRALSLFDERDSLEVAKCWLLLGHIQFARSQLSDALKNTQRALQTFTQAGDRFEEAYCLEALGQIACLRDDRDAAERYFSEGRELHQLMGNRRGMVECMLRHGELKMRCGQLDQAEQDTLAASEICKSLDEQLGDAYCQVILAEIAYQRSELVAAEERATHALDLSRRVEYQKGVAACLRLLARIDLARSEFDSSQKRLSAAMKHSVELGERYGEADTLLAQGELALAQQNRKAAIPLLQSALELFQEIGAPLEIEKVRRFQTLAAT